MTYLLHSSKKDYKNNKYMIAVAVWVDKFPVQWLLGE